MPLKIFLGTAVLLVCCASLGYTADNNPESELCPCLPSNLCPRVYGASLDDRKYLGEFMKCEKDGQVRCCGASVSSLINSVEDEEEDSSEENRNPPKVIKKILSKDDIIEDVRIEHLTIPPPVTTTTTEAPEELSTTTEPIETTTYFTTEEPLETTTIFDEDSPATTTEPPEVTPRYGKGVQFIYAMTPVELEQESKRRGKKLSFEEENVFIIMSQRFLENELENEIEQEDTTTTEAPAQQQHQQVDDEIITTTLAAEGRFADEAEFITTSTEIPEIETTTLQPEMITTTTTTSTTLRPRIRKRIRVKVRKGFRSLARIAPSELQSLELSQQDVETTTKESTRKNRDLEETKQPQRKINKSLYERRRQRLQRMGKNITTTTTTTEASPVTVQEETSEDSTTIQPEIIIPSTEETPKNPALSIFTKNAAKRRNFYNRRMLKSDHSKPQPQPEKKKPSPPNRKPTIKSEAIPTVNMETARKALEGQHQKVIEQVSKSIEQDSMMSTFDIAAELMDPVMAVHIANIQKMLAEEIMESVLKRIAEKVADEEGSASTTSVIKSTTELATESPINAIESKQAPMQPYRGSKRYIDTNFLNAYENVIHKVEDKIKAHKNRAGNRPPVATTTTTEKAKVSTAPANVQILLNNRRGNRYTTTTPLPITSSPAVTEASPVLEIIEELEKKIQFQDVTSTSSPRDFKPSRLWEVINISYSDTQDELSAPIDLLAGERNTRALNNRQGFVPLAYQSVDTASLFLPSLEGPRRFA